LDSGIKSTYFDLTELIQHEFDRNLIKHGAKIKCSRGCSGCCSHIFNITLLDGLVISEHISKLPQVQREYLQLKAKTYLEEKEKQENSLIPCPALGNEGECTIYEARPVICRRFGVPIYDYKKPGSIYACELNFKAGEEIIDDELIPKQTEIGMKWDELKDEFMEKIGNEQKNHTTIAEAILRSL